MAAAAAAAAAIEAAELAATALLRKRGSVEADPYDDDVNGVEAVKRMERKTLHLPNLHIAEMILLCDVRWRNGIVKY